jgi:hypothetical protein
MNGQWLTLTVTEMIIDNLCGWIGRKYQSGTVTQIRFLYIGLFPTMKRKELGFKYW